MDDLTLRNFMALSDGLKTIRASNEKQVEDIKKLRDVVGMLQQQVIALQQQNGIMMARLQGNGRTT